MKGKARLLMSSLLIMILLPVFREDPMPDILLNLMAKICITYDPFWDLSPFYLNLIGNGVIIDPFIFIKEIDKLAEAGIEAKENSAYFKPGTSYSANPSFAGCSF
jgi:hypothetical protein